MDASEYQDDNSVHGAKLASLIHQSERFVVNISAGIKPKLFNWMSGKGRKV